ncbi:MAG: hypothetical protein HY677_00555 [Chloroflexi bacterium]|nr:hypothetical protein [Chloroflexota bacterium]
MLNGINAERRKAGLQPVGIQDAATKVARMRASDMATRNYFAHVSPDGVTAFDLLKANGVDPGGTSEIIGEANGPDDQSVSLIVNAFMKSPSHREQILTARYNLAGVGEALGSGNVKYYAIVFLQR